jgi:hypothetical protein
MSYLEITVMDFCLPTWKQVTARLYCVPSIFKSSRIPLTYALLRLAWSSHFVKYARQPYVRIKKSILCRSLRD